VHKNNSKPPQRTNLSIGRLKPLAAFIAGLVVASPVLAEQLVLEEIVVTAQKRAESVQDVGATINAFQSDTLENYSVLDFTEIEQLTPGLTLNAGDARKKEVSLRGVSYNGESGASAAVDSYWNGAAVSSSAIFGQTYDIERIEVLRGPQGTLQGKTSPAGAIMLITAKPDFEMTEGKMQQTFSDSGTNTQFGIGMPLIPGELAVRVAGAYTEDEGKGNDNVTTGSDEEGRSRGSRVTVGWLPSEEFSAQLVLQRDTKESTAFQPVVGQDENGLRPTVGTYDRQALANSDNSFEQRANLSALELNWELPNHQLTSVSSYQSVVQEDRRDKDFENELPGESLMQDLAITRRTVSQELRLASTDSDFWEYIVGAYYAKKTASTEFTLDRRDTYPGLEIYAPAIPKNSEEFGLFSHNTLNFTDATRMQVGARWQKVRRLSRYDMEYRLNGVTVGAITGIPDELTSNSDDVITGGVKVLHDLNEDVMVYTSIDTSFRAGGTIIAPRLTENAADLIYGNETSKSVEFGLKASLWEDRAQLNAAVFYQQFDDYITRLGDVLVDTDLDGTGDDREHLVFNGDAIISGAEVDFKVLMSENWMLSGGVGYSDARFDGAEIPCDGESGDYDGVSGIVRCSADGQRIGGEPNWSASLTSEHTIPMDVVEAYVRGLYKFTDARSNDNVADGGVPSYGVFNLYAGVRSNDGNWEVGAWVKNLLDTEAEVRRYPEESPGYRKVEVLNERSLGLTAKYNFSL